MFVLYTPPFFDGGFGATGIFKKDITIPRIPPPSECLAAKENGAQLKKGRKPGPVFYQKGVEPINQKEWLNYYNYSKHYDPCQAIPKTAGYL